MIRALAAIAVLFLVVDGLADGPSHPPYHRVAWPHWTASPAHPCRDVRTEVLAREGAGIVWEDERRCRIRSGHWIDPYTAKTITDPAQLDVDHLVPLRRAHAAGGWAWTVERRRDYANDLGYRWHLVATDRAQNRAKGARGPDAWRPPAPEAHCRYAERWAAVAVSWGLEVAAAERAALREMLTTCR